MDFQVTELLDSLPGDVYRKREDPPGSANEPLLDVSPPLFNRIIQSLILRLLIHIIDKFRAGVNALLCGEKLLLTGRSSDASYGSTTRLAG